MINPTRIRISAAHYLSEDALIIASDPGASEEELHLLSTHRSLTVQQAVANNPATGKQTLKEMALTGTHAVCSALEIHPNITPMARTIAKIRARQR